MIMAPEKDKPQKDPLYLINAPIDKLIADENVTFVGETERDRLKTAGRFTRLRNVILKGVQIYTKDEIALLYDILTGYIVEKKE